VDKKEILRQIKGTAVQNGGIPLGQRRFEAETGIKEHVWRGRHWAPWGDANEYYRRLRRDGVDVLVHPQA
jgi:hypothetical protein